MSVGDAVTRLRPQLIDLLVCLASRAGQTVSKDEILETVWPGQFIAESGLTRCVAELRQVFGDAPQDSRVIETIPKRGYRLIAPVRFVPMADEWPMPPNGEPPLAGGTPPPPNAEPPLAGGTPPLPGGGPPVTGGTPVPLVGGKRSRASALVRRQRFGWIGAALVLVAALATAVWWYAWRTTLGEQDTVVLAVENGTGDRVFDEALRLALAVQLEQSPYLRVVSEQRIRDELRFMNQAPDATITRAIAMEACQRVGAKAVLVVSLTPLGRHYLIGVEGLNCRSGDVLARQQLEVDGKEAVVAGLGQAVSGIRRHLGESVASIRRNDVPIVQATTSSIEALNELSLAERAQGRGQDEEAVRLYQRAVELDPTFALAYVKLGSQLLALWRYGEALDALQKAYSLRDRASAVERLYITADYYHWVARDPIRATGPLEAARDAFPRSPVPRVGLASLYGQLGRFDQALAEGREALRLDPDNALATATVAEVLLRLNRFDEAKQTGEQLIARQRENVQTRLVLSDIAFVQGDIDGLRRQLEWAAATPAAESAFLRHQGGMAMFGGKVETSTRLWRQCGTRASDRGDRALAAALAFEEARGRALLGWTTEVVAITSSILQSNRSGHALIGSAVALGLAGQTDAAERLVREYQALPDLEAGVDPDSRPIARALIAHQQGRTDDALELMAPLRPYDLAPQFRGLPPYVRGLILLGAGRPAEAVREFERLTSHRGIVPSQVIYPMAWLQLARARAKAGDAAGSRQAYDQFFIFLEDADAGIPALLQARKESGR
ncbi:MAG TPA: winged helix-turn-helix domain-containing protein [Vicinamibacterales bacterium]